MSDGGLLSAHVFSAPQVDVSNGTLAVRVGPRSYFFEKDADTGQYLYMGVAPTIFPEEDDELDLPDTIDNKQVV